MSGWYYNPYCKILRNSPSLLIFLPHTFHMKTFLTSAFIVMMFCFSRCGSGRQTAVVPNVDSIYNYSAASEDGIGKFYYGREIAAVMDASGSAWLDRSNRQKEENPRLAVNNIYVAANAVIADIGAGTGYFTFKLAAKVPKGKVYAVELQDELIRQLKKNKKKNKTANVVVVQGSDTNTNLPDSSVDLVLMADVYHELEYPQEMLHSISRSLKPNGRILLLEYRGEDKSIPIKELHKMTVAQLNTELGANGFKLFFQGEFLPIQHFLIYTRK